MFDTIIEITDISVFIKTLTKIRKNFPDAKFIYDGINNPQEIKQLALGFIKSDLSLDNVSELALKHSDYQQLEDKSGYTPLIFLG